MCLHEAAPGCSCGCKARARVMSSPAGARAQYSYTFKPLLDVLLFTRSLSKTMGYKVPPWPHVTRDAHGGALH